ncbi:transposase, partial [Raoultella sp. C349492]
IFGGNKRAAMPVSKMETLQEKRRQRRLQRIDEQRDEIEAEARGTLPGESRPDFGSLFIDAEPVESKPIFLLETDREEYFKKTNSR